MPLPDEALALRLLREIGAPPTAPYREDAAAAAVAAELERLGLATRRDPHGNLHAAIARGDARGTIAFVAHLDHPALEVVDASGTRGIARVRGGLFLEPFDGRVAVLVQRETGPCRGWVRDFVWDPERADWSPGIVRIEAEAELRVGDWAVLDLPAFAREGDEVRMRAADDLAGCAMILATLHALAGEARPHRTLALFTRAEEPGLFGARLVAEDGLLPRDALVVSLETSRALPGAEPGRGPVIRVGDAHHTFDDRAESYLRAARERLALADPPVPVQRQLMYGGTCEASAFVDAGYRATAVALPLRNYHNKGERGVAPEVISLADFRAGVALLVEAAVAAGEDAREAHTLYAGTVPDEVRRRLR